MEAPIAPKRVALLTLAVILFGLFFPLPAFSMLLLTEDQFDQDNPIISGNSVVWLDWRNGISELWLYDLATGSQTALPLAGAVLNDPAGNPTLWSVSNKLVAWQDYGADISTSRVYLYDLANRSFRPAKPEGTAAQRGPAVWQDKAAWVEAGDICSGSKSLSRNLCHSESGIGSSSFLLRRTARLVQR